MSNLLAGLVQGYAQGQQQKLQQEEAKELRKLQVKMFQRELDMEDEKKAAQKKLMDLLSGGQPIPNFSPNDDEGNPLPVAQTPARGLKDVLGSPEGQSAALGAGYKINDLRQFQQPGIAEVMAGLQMPQGSEPGKPGSFEMTGFKLGPDGQMMPDFSRNEVNRWVQDPTGKFEIGIDALGRELTRRPAPADKENKITPEQAGRVSMLEQGIGDIDQATKIFFPNGELDKTVLFQMNTPGGGIGKGREAFTLMQNAVAAKLRLETGATAPINEVRDIALRFVPSPLDLTNPGLAEEKMKRLREFMTSTLDISTLPPETRKRVEARIKSRGGPSSTKTVDFNSLPK